MGEPGLGYFGNGPASPVALPGMPNVTSVSAGAYFTLVVHNEISIIIR
jgi:hypothetical protein